MKRKSLLLLLLLALVAPCAVKGQTRATLTVHDGTTTNSYVPVYGYYADAYLKCEMVYPASELTAMSGGQITALKFYASQSSVSWDNANFQVFVAEVSSASINSFNGPGTVVYNNSLNISNGEMTVTFTTPYTYNGGNLLVGVYNTTTGSYVTSSWYGQDVNNSSYQGYSYSSLDAVSGTQRNFLPKTTFTYTPGSTPYISVSPTSATLVTGATQTLTATYGNVTNPNISWASSNTNVATVNGNGTTATVTGVANGTATITATMTYNGTNYTATSTITVDNSVVIGTGTSTGNYTPLVGNYKSSYDQMIYTASQLQDVGIITAGSITKIGFNSSVENSQARNVKIYMGHTSKTSFTSGTDFIAFNDLTLVYDYSASGNGQWNITAGWNEFELDTPFDYDGASNLVIAVHCGLVSDYSSTSFYYTTTSSAQAVYAYNDSTDPIPATYDGNWSDYPTTGSGATSYKSTTTSLPNLKVFFEVAPQGDYITQITSNDDWEAFCAAVNGGHDYSGETVHLRANISITSQDNQAGMDGKFFKGTFEGHGNTINVNMTATGDYCAPFYAIQNATIKDLIVTGSITSNYHDAAGFCGGMYGDCTFNNCLSNVNITSTRANYVDTRSACGGFAGRAGGGDNPTFVGCAFTGSLSATSQKWGGFIGFHASRSGWSGNYNGVSTFTNCICAPTSINVNGITDNATFVSGYNDNTYIHLTVTNSYYNEEAAKLGTKQGTRAYTITGGEDVTVSMNGTADPTYNVSGISVYSPGITLTQGDNTTIYAKSNDQVSLNLSTTTSAHTGYTVSAGSLSGSANPYTLTMPASNVVINNVGCEVITSFPWTEDFESAATGSPNIPACWEKIISYNSGYSEYPYVYNYSSYAHGGNNLLYMYTYYYSAPENVIALPEMSAINTLQISLWARASSTIPEAFEVGYVKNGTFTALQQYTLTSTYQKFTAYLTEAPADAERIAIRSYHSTSSSTVYVDDITVKVAVNLPTQIVASNPGDNQMTWAQFVDFVNNQAEDFQGLTVTLMDNITVNTMVGTADHPFSGTFDGNNKNLDVDISSDEQGAAPFRYISGATIKRLVVTGYVTAAAHHASGLVGFCAAGSTNKIENCLVHTSVTNNNDYNGDNGNNFIGGLIGHNLTATTTIEGCVYDGTLNSQGFKGGMVGFGDYNSNVVIKDSYFNGSYSTNGYADPNFSPIACHGSGRNFNFTFSNFYYNTEAGTFTAPNYEGTVNASYSTSGRAKLAHFITAVSPAEVFFGGDIVSSYTVSSLNAYATGIVYGALIAGEGDQVALTLSGSSTGVYETSCGTLNGSTLTMGDCNAVISAVTCPAPIGLAASNITGHTVDLNWVGYSDSYNVLYGALDAQGTVLETGFEDGQIPAAFTNDANHRWKVTSGGANNSSYCAIPGNKGVDSSDSDLAFVVIGPGTVSFRAKVSSESGYDYGRFLIDGAQKVNISGTQDWTSYSFELAAGSHTLVWRYHKDVSSYSGEDLFYVDDITVVGLMVGEWQTVTVDEANATLTDLNPETLYEAKVQGVCDGDEMSNPSETITFTTLEACPVPYNLTIPSSEITANSAFLTWVGGSDSYNVSLGVDSEVTTLVDENFSSSIPAGWTNDATYPWTIVNGHIQSGNVGVTSSTSSISVTVTYPTDGTVSFRLWSRGESTDDSYDWDVSRFYIDNQQKFSYGKHSDWESYSTVVTAGTHTFRWEYKKDGSTNPEGDYFAVDDVQMYCQGIDWNDPVSVGTTEYTITELAPSTKYYVKVQGVCDDEPTAWSDIRNFTTGSGYQVSVSVNNSTMGSASITYNGETVDSPASIAPDTEVTVTATPAESYAFVNWTELNSEGEYVEVEGAGEEYTFVPTSNRDLKANFEKAKHTLTIVAAYGTVKVDGDDYTDPIELEEGGEVYVELSDWGDYQFNGWAVDGTGSEMEYPTMSATTFTMGTANTILTAIFGYEEICFDAGEGTYYDSRDHWFLFTSPLHASVNPSDVYGLFYEEDPNSEYYDLYFFDQTQELEWINWKESEDNGGHFDLEAGKGYLYANKYNDVMLCFTGEPYYGNGSITITNIPDNSFAGWNLVGNPYNREMYSSMSYYAMNNDGDNGPELVSRTNDISLQPMEGFFVYCESGTSTVSLSTTASNAKRASLSLNISRGRGLVDRAIVSFGNGNALPKFQLNPSHTKVYIPKDDKDYAVANAESEMGEMPVNFKAEKSGSYTLSVSTDDVSFGYLHLIDNMTGNDIDLLANPSYTFNASQTDYASRFKLVFATGNNGNDGNFAFFSNGSFVINNDGEAMLQVVDVTGRIIKSESINGCANVNVNAAPGIYMLRLINGDNVRVQKVVVKR